MKPGFEAFQAENYSDKEENRGYEKYKTDGGKLSHQEYEEIMKCAVDQKDWPLNPLWKVHTDVMAKVAGITLLPEVVTIYGILREEKRNLIKDSFSTLSDQELLAEALRMTGDMHSLSTFIQKHTHIFN